jgi:glycosyltransferase involved in cell wall biosynthesis
MRIVFLLRSLNYGGAQRQVVLLAKGIRERGHDVVVATFYPGGVLENEVLQAQVRIRPLHKRGRWDVIGFLVRLNKVLKEERPDIIHSYLHEENLMTLTSPRSTKVVWGIRCGYMDYSHYDWLNWIIFKLNCWLSMFPDAIIANSYTGYNYHLELGYPSAKMAVIPNGIDTDRFRPDPAARQRIRAEWGVPEQEQLIGIVGRLDPMKDHPVFIEAAALLANKRRDIRFVCVGGGPDEYRSKLQKLANSLGLEGRLLWVGARDDMSAVYNAFDISVSSSYGEGLSNVICEAMACGIPCVATNVGDSVRIVGEMGKIVPPKDPAAMCHAIETLLQQAFHTSAQIRHRIVEHFSAEALVVNTENALLKLLSSSRCRTPHAESLRV